MQINQSAWGIVDPFTKKLMWVSTSSDTDAWNELLKHRHSPAQLNHPDHYSLLLDELQEVYRCVPVQLTAEVEL